MLEAGRFRVREHPDPVPGPGQALVATEACGICGSDLSAVAHTEEFLRASRDSAATSFLFDPDRPLVMGHEFSGRVLAHGPGATGPEPGTGVVGLPWAVDPGGVVRTVGYSNAFPGGFGERIVVQAQALLPVPPSLDLALAALTEPLAVGFGNIARSAAGKDTPAVVVNCVGVPGLLNQLLHTVPRGTEILQIGGVMTEDVIRPVAGIYKDVTIRMCLTYPPEEFGATLARLADGRVDPGSLVTGEAGSGGLDAAFASLRRPEEHIKVLIRPGREGTGVVAR